MNRLLKQFVFIIMFFVAVSLYSEEIHLTDGKVLRGSVKGANQGKLIYKDDESFQVLELSLDSVSRIVFAGGIEVDPRAKRDDRIFRKDGTVHQCKVLRIQEDSVFFLREDDILPRSHPIGELEKIIYANGSTLSFADAGKQSKTSEGEKSGQSISGQYTAPTYHKDGKPNLYILILGGFGITKNSDVQTYAEETAERYRIHLQSTYALTGYKTEPGVSDYNPDINLELEARLFFDNGIGFGLIGGLSFPIFEPIDIVNPEGEGVFQVDPIGLFLYAVPVIYYKNYFSSYNAILFYMLGGVGVGICHGKVHYTITEGYSNNHLGTPDASRFENNFSGKTIVYLGSLELGAEESNVALFVGIKIRHAVIEKLTDGDSVMRLNNGSNAQLKLNGAFIYAGIGLFM